MSKPPHSSLRHHKIKHSQKPGPSDFDDPLMLTEAKRAFVWIGLTGLVALAVILAHPLMVIFGGIVFGSLIDGGARLLGRVLPIHRGWRVAIVILLTFLFLCWLAFFAGSQITAQAAALPTIIEQQTSIWLDWLGRHGFANMQIDLKALVSQGLSGIGQVTKVVGGLIGGFTTALLIVVLGVYFAIEPNLYQRGLIWLFPKSSRARVGETMEKMGNVMRSLLGGRLLGMLIEGIATWLCLWIYGVPMAAFLGLLTGLLAFLPNIGAPISGAIMIIVGFSAGVDTGIFCIIVYVVVQTIDGNIIVPMIAKKTADLAPALVLGAQLIMGVLFGILGLMLADPLVAMLKVWLERNAERHGTDDDEPLTADESLNADGP